MATYIRENLIKKLTESIPDIRGKQLWIWGTGDTAQLYQEGLERLREEFEIQGYIDNEPSKIGSFYNGKIVIGPEQIPNINNICILICSIREDVVREISEQLSGFHVEWHLIDEVILKLHAKEVIQCYDIMYDLRAKKVYADTILWRISGKKTAIDTDLGNEYFVQPPFNCEDPEGVFIDCGTWWGDTITSYIATVNGVFKKIIGFELDKDNFRLLQEQIRKVCNSYKIPTEKIEIFNCGVGEKMQRGYFSRYEKNGGQGSKFITSDTAGQTNMDIISLDNFIHDKYTFLKADIESYEYRMLCGAERGIRENKPMLTICLYHNAVDLFSLPLLIKKFVPEYKISVYHHAENLAGTVLYAWI